MEAQEERLAAVRKEVEDQLQAEQSRLAAGQEELHSFIQSVQKVCQGQLALLERLPELPVQPAAAPVQAPTAEAAPVDTVEEVASAIDQALVKDIDSAVAALTSTESTVPEPAEAPVQGPLADLPAENPFADDSEEDPDATRILNLDDLQFGRNYTKE